MDSESLHFLKNVLPICVWLGMVVLTLILGLVRIRKVKKHWKKGLLLGLICVALLGPLLVFRLAHLDVSAIMGQHGEGGLPDARLLSYVVIGFALVACVVRIPWYGFIYHTAISQWDLIEPDAFPILDKSRVEEGSSLLPALIVGVIAGGVSVWVFWALQIEMSGPLKRTLRLYSGAMEAPVAIRVALGVPAVLVPAIIEELVFRGILMGFAKRVFGRNRASLAAVIIVAAALWGILHLVTTTRPGVKFAQIFIIGLVLGWFARNGKIEKAIVAHAGLNVVAVVAGLILTG